MTPSELRLLPGGDLVSEGIRDLEQGECTDNALLVLIASPRLRSLGIQVPDLSDIPLPHEHRLYERLEDQYGPGAHSRYNALIRRIVSFSHALAQMQSGSAIGEPPS